VVSGRKVPRPCPPIAYGDNIGIQLLQAFAQEQGWTEVKVVTEIGSPDAP
jgi:hypothetical protein